MSVTGEAPSGIIAIMPVRPDLQSRYDADIDQLQSIMATVRDASHVDTALFAAERAASLFAGSRDADELQLRHTALLHGAGALRSSGRLAEAEAAFARAGEMANTEIGQNSREHWLSYYFVGVVRQQQNDNAGAAEALRIAFDGFVASAQWRNEARLTGAALGLSLLREWRWADVVEVLSRIANPSNVDESEASIHHNLALALVRSGEAGIKTAAIARAASSLRERVSGAGHPLTIETWLVEALALADAGATDASAELIRKAAGVILSGPGEAHPFFARALLAEARRIAHLGDGAAAEALCRRAIFILDRAGVPPENKVDYVWESRAIPALWRPAAKATEPSDVRLWRLEFQHTLRRYQVATLDFAGSGEVAKVWYLFVPASVRMEAGETALRWVRTVLADANARLNAREPADANFIDVTSVVATNPTPAEIVATPPMDFFPQRTWEEATGFSLIAGSSSIALPPGEFAEALHACLALQGATADREAWAALGLDTAALQAATEEPAETLQRVLGFSQK